MTPSANLSEPIVRVTLRISTSRGNLTVVEYELKQSVANSTAPMVAGFRAKGHNVTSIQLDSMTASFVSAHSLLDLKSECLRRHTGCNTELC